MSNKNLCIEIANYFLKNKSTVRKTAVYFNISKSTVHNYLHKKLPKINKKLGSKVQKLLDLNKNLKHIRGGKSTKERWLKLKKITNKKQFI